VKGGKGKKIERDFQSTRGKGNPKTSFREHHLPPTPNTLL
jgi:hypothetical protein